MASFLAWTSMIVLLLLGLFLMIVVLLQRGRGGGLAGAFGGMGGQSAFGTKAGDVFTKITIVVALLWVVTAGGSGFFMRAAAEQKGQQFGDEIPAANDTDPEVPTSPSAGNVPALPKPPSETSDGGAEDDTAAPASESDAAADESATDAEPADATPALSAPDDAAKSGDESENPN